MIKVIELNGTFFNAIGQIIGLEDILEINFIVRTNMQLKVIGIIVLILLGGVLLSENVTINGNIDPTFVERLGAVLIGFIVFLAIPSFGLLKLKNRFKESIKVLI